MAAESILKRLMEAEEQARDILKAAEERAKETIEGARQEAEQMVEAARRETESMLRGRLQAAEAQGAEEKSQHLEKAEADAREFGRRANTHLPEAVAMVVDWVINRGD
jgi:vacuolar-type H+-ATPase subunit H